MIKNSYNIVDDFQVRNVRVVVLDSEYEPKNSNKALIGGKKYDYLPNSVPNWIVLQNISESLESLKGKLVEFVSV